MSVFIIAAYYTWVLYDSGTRPKDSGKSQWAQSPFFINFVRDYFPLRLIKTAELPAGKPYILGLFPHGVFPFGGLFNLCTNMNNVSELFPGLDIREAFINFSFYAPCFRELLTALGCCTSSEEDIKYFLESNPPKAVGIYPGGAKEVYVSHPGNKYTIIKENRKGFVRVALQTGSSLVPVFSFGEQNPLDQLEVTNPFVLFCFDLIRKVIRARPAVPNGRGFLQNKFGLLPKRYPITTVVGKPIPVPKVENPSSALIDEYHERFHEALRNLFEENKRTYDEFGDEATLETI